MGRACTFLVRFVEAYLQRALLPEAKFRQDGATNRGLSSGRPVGRAGRKYEHSGIGSSVKSRSLTNRLVCFPWSSLKKFVLTYLVSFLFVIANVLSGGCTVKRGAGDQYG